MKPHVQAPRRPGGALAAVAALAIAGLTLAGCGGSSGSSGSGGSTGGSGSAGGASTPAAATTSTAAAQSAGSAGNNLWPAAVGDTWTYRTTEPDGDDSPRTETDKITAVSPVSGGNQVTEAEDVHHSDGTTSSDDSIYVFQSDGSVIYPLDKLDNNSGGDSIVVKSGTLGLPSPAVLASGTPTSTTLQATISGSGISQTLTVDVTVKGEGTESVTVPAGTYTATVADIHTSGTVMGIQFGSDLKVWLANGVGPVQTEDFIDVSGSSKLTVQSELTSFANG